jgi:hypothetical protein
MMRNWNFERKVKIMRDEYIGFKVTQQENEHIRKKAVKAKMMLSEYVRVSALEKTLRSLMVCVR